MNRSVVPGCFMLVLAACGGGSGSGSASIGPPTIADAALTTPENAPLAVSLSVTGVAVSFQIARPPGHGALSGGGPTWTYAPERDYTGADSFMVRASNSAGSATATVSITVTPVDAAPVAVDDVATIAEDTSLTLAAVTLLGNDSDVDGPSLAVTAVGNASHGTVSLAAGMVTFVPAHDYAGPASFEYTVGDGSRSAIGTVAITVTPVNDPPVVASSDGLAEYVEGDPASIIDPSLAVSDVDSATLAAATVTLVGCQAQDALALAPPPAGIAVAPYDPVRCTLTLAGTASVADYQAALRRVAFASASEDPSTAARSVRFEVDDGAADSSTGAASRALHVVAVDDAPVAVGDAITTVEDTSVAVAVATLLANDTDVDGPSLAVTAVGNASHGTVSLAAGTVTFAPARDYAGPASFEYTVSDGTARAVATVAVTVTPVNDPPVVVASDGFAEYVENAAPVAVDPSLAVSDVDSATLAAATVTLVGCQAQDALALASPPAGITVAPYDPVHCALALTGTASAADYQAALRRVAFASASEDPSTVARSVRFEVDDGAADSSTGAASRALHVVAVDDTPVAVDDAVTTDEDTSVTIAAATLLANDSDVDGPSLAVTAVGNASHGAVSLFLGMVTFAPARNYAGPASFEYTVSDGTASAVATVAVIVTPVNDPPVVATQDTTLEIAERAGPVAVDPEIAVTDLDSPALAGATVAITAGCQAQDALALDAPPPGITVQAYDPVSCALVVTGAASAASYQDALARVTFRTTEEVLVADARTVQFTVDDGGGGDHLGSAARHIALTPVDTAPAAVDDSATVDEDAPAQAIDVLANDTDADGGPRSIASATQPGNGTVVVGPRSLTYQPRADYCNEGAPRDSFTYTLAPGGSTATVRVAVRCASDPVVAVDDVATVDEGSADNRIDVLANDRNPDGGPIAVLDAGPATSGATVSIAPGGATVLYTPPPGYCNEIANTPRDRFPYTITGDRSAGVAVTVRCACGRSRTTDFIVGDN